MRDVFFGSDLVTSSCSVAYVVDDPGHHDQRIVHEDSCARRRPWCRIPRRASRIENRDFKSRDSRTETCEPSLGTREPRAWTRS